MAYLSTYPNYHTLISQHEYAWDGMLTATDYFITDFATESLKSSNFRHQQLFFISFQSLLLGGALLLGDALLKNKEKSVHHA